MRLIAIFFVLLSTAQAQDYPITGRVGDGRIGGLEYWPFDDAIPGSPYPDRVLWSFEEGSEKAQACMLEANKKLVSWLSNEDHPVAKAIKHYKEIGGNPSFFMWTNDYTKAPSQAARGVRRNRVWWWSGSGSETSGFLKFESTVMPDGTCKTPDEQQTVSYIENRYSLFAENVPEVEAVSSQPVNIDQSSRREIKPSFFQRIRNFFSSSDNTSR